MAQILLESLNNFYEPLLKQIDPYGLGRKQRALSIGVQYATRMIMQFGKEDLTITRQQIFDFVDYLTNGCPEHGYVIDYDIGNSFIKGLFHTSDTFGIEYENALHEVSKFFMDNGEIEQIKFCPDKLPSEEKKEDESENKKKVTTVNLEEPLQKSRKAKSITI